MTCPGPVQCAVWEGPVSCEGVGWVPQPSDPMPHLTLLQLGLICLVYISELIFELFATYRSSDDSY